MRGQVALVCRDKVALESNLYCMSRLLFRACHPRFARIGARGATAGFCWPKDDAKELYSYKLDPLAERIQCFALSCACLVLLHLFLCLIMYLVNIPTHPLLISSRSPRLFRSAFGRRADER